MIFLNYVKRICIFLSLCVDTFKGATIPPQEADCIRRDAHYVINSLYSQDTKLVEMLKNPKHFQSSEEVNRYFDELAYFNKCFYRLYYLIYAHVREYTGVMVDLIVNDGPRILHVDLLSDYAKTKYWLNDKKKYATAEKLINITRSHWEYLRKCFPITPYPVPTYFAKPFTDNY